MGVGGVIEYNSNQCANPNMCNYRSLHSAYLYPLHVRLICETINFFQLQDNNPLPSSSRSGTRVMTVLILIKH